MINNKYISLVLPCKNEGRALEEVLKKSSKEIDEIIVVDNNSNDTTIKTARKFGVRVIRENRNENGIGYGYALARGIRESKGDIIVCMDGDDSYPISDLPRLVRSLEKESLDFISCNRLPFKDRKDMSLIRTLGVKGLNLFFWVLYGYKIKDCLSGMWVFKRQVANNITLFEGGWNFSLEIKLNTIKNKRFKFAEKPVFYHDRVFDQSKQNLLETGIKHLLFLTKSRFNYSKRGFSILQPKTSLSNA